MSAAIRGLQQLDELLGCQVGLAQDRSKRPGGEIAVAVNGDGDESATVGVAKVVVAAAHVGLLIAGTAKRFDQVAAADSRQSSQGTATSISTTSSWWSSSGTGTSLEAAASK